VPRFLAAGRTAAEAAIAVPRMPEDHRAGERQQRPFAPVDARPDLAQIGEPHRRRLDPRRSLRRGVQQVKNFSFNTPIGF
jgi:hypothetical protein